MEVWVLRLGHRIFRDQRVTTHCALVARAFGASRIVYSGDRDKGLEETIRKVVEKWGGPFDIVYERQWKRFVKEWKGKVVHLTMYGLPIQEMIEEIRACKEDLLIIVGGKKVPAEVYELSDWNVSVTQQPHSEISALCLFLDRFFEGKELEKEFKGGRLKIIPSKREKNGMRMEENLDSPKNRGRGASMILKD